METSIAALFPAWNKDPELCLNRAVMRTVAAATLAGNIECRRRRVTALTDSVPENAGAAFYKPGVKVIRSNIGLV